MRAKEIDAEFIERARVLAMEYTVVFEPDEQGGFVGRSFEMPGVLAHGAAVGTCEAEVREALAATIAAYLSQGKRPPPPASQRRRGVQLNIRVSSYEKWRLEKAAEENGLSLSDYMRSVALRAANR